MYIRIFVEAINKEEALNYSKKFENVILKCVVDIKITKIEQYWKMPELYCVEFEFKNVIPERITEVIKELGNNPYTVTNDEKIEEYIFAKTTGEIYLEKIEWILINVGV